MTESPTLNKWMANAAAKAKAEDLVRILEDKFGAVPPELKAKIESTAALDVLLKWVLTAARVGTIDKFRQEANL